ncbi:MAG: Cof-type HAD-IIB family hydrolase [Bacteroidaceae bacterium]|nr:Cof-type HAD-IIB family hydrolase [Bacteroidaceae bacterium]
MNYKLIAVDLDGTLTNTEKKVTPRNINILVKAQQSGIRLCIVSGRPLLGTIHIAQELRMNEYEGIIIACNGGVIINCQTQETYLNLTLPNETIPLIYNYAKKNGECLFTFCGKHIITENPENRHIQISALRNMMTIKPSDNFLNDIELPLNKCVIAEDQDKAEQAEKQLQKFFEGRITALRTEPYFIELVPLGIDKGKALAKLAKKLHIDRKEIIAFGDGFNDQTMIKYAGMGIAMQNAQAPVKEVANMITASNDDDGVASALEKLIL